MLGSTPRKDLTSGRSRYVDMPFLRLWSETLQIPTNVIAAKIVEFSPYVILP
jgi:hypothetical protein